MATAGKDVRKVSVRENLNPRREPYWWHLERGRYVGFRRMSKATPGAWIARYYDGDKYHTKPLGEFATLPEAERYAEAKRQAEEWFAHLNVGGSFSPESVKAACQAYADMLRAERSEQAAKDAEGAFRRLVNDDAIGKIDLTKVKPKDFENWRKRILDRGSKTYFNRNLTPLRAAMNYARDRGRVSSDFALQKALRPIKLDKDEGRRSLYLTVAERRTLLEKASAELQPLLKSWMLLPVRPGDIANLRVEHLDARNRVLKIPEGKTGSRAVPLAATALAHFQACARGKLPSAWLVSRSDGRQWDRFAWREQMKDAVKDAKLPKATVAYTVRHSVVTDLVTAGVDLFTVAKLAGTSLAMVDKFYGQLQQEHARDALEKIRI